MELSSQHIKLLGLSRSEIKVLDALRDQHDTPVRIARVSRVSRPAIYEILTRLHKRGLITSNIRNGKKYWSQAKDRDLELELFNTKKELFNISDGVQEIAGLGDSTVIVHRGGESIRLLIRGLMKDNKDTRLQAIQGDTVVIGWNKVFGIEGTNELNRLIKQNRIITEGILPHGWFKRQTRLLGKKWAQDFEGRAAVTHEIDEKYFQHGGQIWIFKRSLYLVAMNEEIIIEIRNSEIKKIILAMFRFIQDNSRKIDVNALLRDLIQIEENRESEATS